MKFEELQELVAFCTGEHASSFYRKLYGLAEKGEALSIRTLEEWNALPIFSKDQLSSIPLKQRMFPGGQALSLLASSGTAGKLPVFTSWASYNESGDFRFRYHSFKKTTLVSIPTVQKIEWELSQHEPTARVIGLDAKRAHASLKLAQAAGCDSLILFALHVPIVAEKIKTLGMADSIHYVEITGEKCSHSLYTYVRNHFPRATIVSHYGSTEAESSPIGIPCYPMDGRAPLEVFHVNSNTHLEIVDPETGLLLEPKAGVEGLLVVTSRANADMSFPLVRYNIGDLIRVCKTICTKHGTWSFEVLGRWNSDFIKTPGGVLRVDEIERVLRELYGQSNDTFTAHYYEHVQPPRIELELQLQNGIDLGAQAEPIMQRLRIGASYTYAQAVADGLLLPLSCVPLSTQQEGKRVRLMRHS